MKKLVCVLLVISLLMGCSVSVFAAEAQNNISLTLSSDKKTVSPDEAEIEVKLNIADNPGIWALRCYIVYPEKLSLDAVENGGLFAEGCLMEGIYDLPLSDSRQTESFKELIASENIPSEGYRSITLYFEEASVLTLMTKNGALATLGFTFEEKPKEGEIFDICVYTANNDVIKGTIDSSGNVQFEKYYPETRGVDIEVYCVHADTCFLHLDPTCSESGYDKEICRACEKVLSDISIPATGKHAEGEPVIVSPTCAEDGKRSVYCKDCGNVIVESVLPATGIHTEGETVVIDATCTEEGSRTTYCKECNEVLKSETLELLAHIPLENTECTSDSVCTVCNTVLRPALGHLESDVGILEPTCTVGGARMTYCLRCGTIMVNEAIPAKGHTPGEAEIIEPSCTEEGMKIALCTVCGEVAIKEPIAPTGHIYELQDNWTRVEPTCTEEGYTEKKCDVCSEAAVFDITAPYGHDSDGEEEIVQSTCSVPGELRIYCSVCGELSERSRIPLADHTFSEGICTVCGVDELYARTDEFAVYLDPVYGESVDLGEEYAVELGLINNPGIWAARFYIVYPEALTLTGIENGELFPRSCLLTGIYDLPLNDNRQVASFKELIIEEGIAVEGYRSVTVYFESATVNSNVIKDGILADFIFELTDKAAPGETYSISVYSAENDVINAYLGADGMPVFEKYMPERFFANAVCFCEHENTFTDIKEPTCSQDGYENTVCSLCKTVIESTVYGATGIHTEGEEVKTEPTCSSDGKGTVSCSACGTLLWETVYPATALHTAGEPSVTEPTCTENGKSVTRCTVCFVIMSEKTIESTGHTSGGNPTCTEDEVCLSCNEILNPSFGHTEGEEERCEPSCTESGSVTVCCSVCDTLMRSEVIEALGHSYEKEGSIIKVPPSCTEEGHTEMTCDRCGDKLRINTTPAAGHNTDGDVIKENATCTATGYEHIYCSVCGEISKITILPIEGHKYVNGVCSICKKAYSESNYENFTVDIVTEGVENMSSAFKAELRLENNPGIWALRCYIVYPEELTLIGLENAEVFPAGCLLKGVFDLAVSDSRQVSGFKDIIVEKSIPTEGYRAVTVYFESNSVLESITENGVLADLTFAFDDGACLNEIYEITVYTGEDDVINAYIGADGMPVFIKYEPDTVGCAVTASCDHSKREAITVEKENGESCVLVVCCLCGTETACAPLPDGALYVAGDINSDGTVNAIDSSYMKRFLGGVGKPDELQEICMDINKDGKLNGIDSNLLSGYLAGKIAVIL